MRKQSFGQYCDWRWLISYSSCCRKRMLASGMTITAWIWCGSAHEREFMLSVFSDRKRTIKVDFDEGYSKLQFHIAGQRSQERQKSKDVFLFLLCDCSNSLLQGHNCYNLTLCFFELLQHSLTALILISAILSCSGCSKKGNLRSTFLIPDTVKRKNDRIYVTSFSEFIWNDFWRFRQSLKQVQKWTFILTWS